MFEQVKGGEQATELSMSAPLVEALAAVRAGGTQVFADDPVDALQYRPEGSRDIGQMVEGVDDPQRVSWRRRVEAARIGNAVVVARLA